MARSKVTDKVAEDSSHSVSVVDQNPKLAEGGKIFLRDISQVDTDPSKLMGR